MVDALFLEFSAQQVCQPDAAYAGASIEGAMTSSRPGIVDRETEFLKKLIKRILIVRPEGNVLKLQSLSSRFEKWLKMAPEVEYLFSLFNGSAYRDLPGNASIDRGG